MSHNSLFILNYVFSIFCLAILLYAISQFIPLRVKLYKPILIITIFRIFHNMIMFSFIVDYFARTGNVVVYFLATSLLVVFDVVIVLWAYKERVWKKLSIYFFLEAIAFFGDFSITYFAYHILGIGMAFDWESETNVFYMAPDYLYPMVARHLIVIMVYGFGAWVGRKIMYRRTSLSFLLFPIFPVGQILFMVAVVNTGQIHSIWILLGLMFAVVANIMLLVVLLEQDKKLALQEELSETRHRLKLEQFHFNEIEKRREELAKIRHDFNNHLAAINGMIQSANINSAKEMIDALSSEIIGTNESPYCNIPAVNAILLEKVQTCEKLGIGLAVDINLPHNLAIEQMHLCSIFGNLLDNAIRACNEQNHTNSPTIQLSSLTNGDYLFVKVANPSNEPPKKTIPGRGYGSRILSDLAAKYGGSYQAEYVENMFTAMVSVLVVEG